MRLASGLIDHIQKMTIAAMTMADMKVLAPANDLLHDNRKWNAKAA